MTQDEILTSLRKVVAENQQYTTWTVSTPHLVLLVNQAVEAEREQCAKVVEVIEAQCIAKDVDDPPLKHIAEAIRARGNT
jgi:bacteriorhodopsin